MVRRELIIGYGEIGRAVQEAICFNEAKILDKKFKDLRSGFDVIHICFPYSETFVDDVVEYIRRLGPKHVIVYSTVPIGTCGAIDDRIVHSPIESKHPDLALGIRLTRRWVGYNQESEGQFFRYYFANKGLDIKMLSSTRFTEALKLISTTEYGVNIVFADYKKRIADDLDMPYELTKEWNQNYNKLYKDLGLGDRFQKFVLDPPNGRIGGHCVRENSVLLNEQYPNEWVEKIGSME